MSLAETNVSRVAKKLYRYKLKAYMNLFFTMIVLQVMALLFSLGGVGSMFVGFASGAVRLRYYSSDMLVVFTAFWIFIVAVMITTKEYRDIDFVFVANRLRSNVANIAFLATASMVGGLTAILGGSVLRVAIYFSLLGGENIALDNFFLTPWELLITITAATLYFLLLGAIGYFSGILVQLSKAFIVLLPGIFIGFMIVAVRSGHASILVDAMSFFLDETSVIVLVTKILLSAGILFFGATALSGRLEVRI